MTGIHHWSGSEQEPMQKMAEWVAQPGATNEELIALLLQFPIGSRVQDVGPELHPDNTPPGFGTGTVVAHRPYVWGENQDKLGILFDVIRDDAHPSFPDCRVNAKRLRRI